MLAGGRATEQGHQVARQLIHRLLTDVREIGRSDWLEISGAH